MLSPVTICESRLGVCVEIPACELVPEMIPIRVSGREDRLWIDRRDMGAGAVPTGRWAARGRGSNRVGMRMLQQQTKPWQVVENGCRIRMASETDRESESLLNRGLALGV